MDVIFDPSSEQTAILCWDGIVNDPTGWTASVTSNQQGQAWWSETPEFAHLVYRDRFGLVAAYQFEAGAANPMESLESGRALWKAVSNLLLKASFYGG